MVEARGVGLRYPSGRTGVDEVGLTLLAGERLVLMGPNGSGKSSLLRLVTGELRPTSGEISVLGWSPPGATSARRRRVGVASDRPVHLDALSGRANALLFARAAGIDPATARLRVHALLERFDLGADADAPAGEYSHGMRRKLLLVEAVAHRPELLVLDEPTLGLDPPAVDAIVDVVARAAAEHGAAALVATNDLAVAHRLADRILFLHEGRVVADGSPRDLLARVEGRPTTVEVALSGAGDGAHAKAELARGLAGAFPGSSVEPTDEGLVARLPGGPSDVARLVEAVVAAGSGLRRIDVREPNLGDVFRALTGSELKGPDAGGAAP